MFTADFSCQLEARVSQATCVNAHSLTVYEEAEPELSECALAPLQGPPAGGGRGRRRSAPPPSGISELAGNFQHVGGTCIS